MKRLSLVFLAILPAFFLFICGAALAEGTGERPRVSNGNVYLPEENMPRIPLAELNYAFPKETPKELLDLKGNIYRGELEGTSTTKGLKRKLSQVTYLILWGYRAETKEAVIYFVWERGHDGRPSQGKLKGVFNPGGETLLRTISKTGMPIEYRLSFLADGKLRIITHSGFSADLSAVGILPDSW